MAEFCQCTSSCRKLSVCFLVYISLKIIVDDGLFVSQSRLEKSEGEIHRQEKHFAHYSDGLAEKKQELETACKAVVHKQAEIEVLGGGETDEHTD